MKALAIVCKILAAIIWIGIAWFKISLDIMILHLSSPPRESPTQIYLEIFVLSVIALLAVVPNRWLVFSRIAFGISLVIALFPLGVNLIHDWRSDPFMAMRNYLDPEALVFLAFIFCPLPFALSLSFWRRRKGEKVAYA